MLKYICFLIFVFLFTESCIAQQTNTLIPPSPDAAALGIYGSIPVSTYTGIPNINIPLYQLDYRDVHLPIGLSYHASGITVEQDASWVGLGWALNVGGLITRTIRGGDDMQFANDGISNLSTIGGYMGYPYDGEVTDYYGVDKIRELCENMTDAEPDIFYFNFLGESGRFVFEQGQNRSLTYVEGTPLEVKKMSIRYNKLTNQWEIKTANGFSYYFGTQELTETHHGSGGGFGKDLSNVEFDPITKGFLTYDDIVVTSWHLDKIVSPLGAEINYIYDIQSTAQSGRSPYGSSQLSLTDVNGTVIGRNIDSFNGCVNGSEVTDVVYNPAQKTFTNHIYLKEIQFGLGKIVFRKSLREDMIPPFVPGISLPYISNSPFFLFWIDPSTMATCYGPQKLDGFDVHDVDGRRKKTIEFTYSYFNNDKSGIEGYEFKRLRLDKLRECGQDDCNPAFKFSYDQTHSLPSKYSSSQDFWGYYNGASNPSKIPYGTYVDITNNKIFYLGDANRQPNAEYLGTGTLNKIVYPAGGSTEFQFEPHDYNQFGVDAFGYTDFENNQDPIVIDELYANPENSPFQVKTFTLTDPIQNLIIDEEMTYYESATTSDPCNVLDPRASHAPNEMWYSLRKISPGAEVIYPSGSLKDFFDFFEDNYQKNCVQQNTPGNIDPIYHKRKMLTLNAGTYELKIYPIARFLNHVIISKNIIHPKIISQNSKGVYAKTAGGLRVKKIITKAGIDAPPQIKNYLYTAIDGEGKTVSTGKLMLYPIYHIFEAFDTQYGTPVGPIGVAVCSYQVARIKGASWSSVPLGTSASGSIVGYDQITELSGEDDANGKTIYYYRNDVEEPSDNPNHLVGLPTISKSSNGLIWKTEILASGSKMIRSELTTYKRQKAKTFLGIAAMPIKGLVSRERLYVTDCVTNYKTQLYSIVSDRWVTDEKTVNEYDLLSNSVSTSMISYNYDINTHLQLSSEETKSSLGASIQTTYLYPPEAPWIPQAMWQNKFIYDKVVEQRVFKGGNLNSSYKASYGQYGNSFLLTKEETTVGSGPPVTQQTFSYSQSGATREVKSKEGVNNVYLWGYREHYPMARISGVTLSQVLVALGNIPESALREYEAEVKPSSSYMALLVSLRSNFPSAFIYTYDYEPLVGMKSATDPNGSTLFYEYDSFGRLILSKDRNGNILKTFTYQYKQ